MAKLHSIGRKLQLLQNESRHIYHIFIALFLIIYHRLQLSARNEDRAILKNYLPSYL